MKTRILAFGIVKEFFNGSSKEVELREGATVSELKSKLELQYPGMKKLRSCLVAVNNEYAEEDRILRAEDEIAIIPPVSGG